MEPQEYQLEIHRGEAVESIDFPNARSMFELVVDRDQLHDKDGELIGWQEAATGTLYIPLQRGYRMEPDQLRLLAEGELLDLYRKRNPGAIFATDKELLRDIKRGK